MRIVESLGRCRMWAIMVVVIVLVVTQVNGQGAAPVKDGTRKVAVICQDGGGLKGDEVEGLLTAALSASKEFHLVDRDEVRKVIAEQKLQALSDAADAIKIGQLAGADVLLFCTGIKGGNPPALRLRAVETVTGVVLNVSFDQTRSVMLLGTTIISATGDIFPQDKQRHTLEKSPFSPRLSTGWDAIEPVGSGFVAIDYGWGKGATWDAKPPVFWLLTPPVDTNGEDAKGTAIIDSPPSSCSAVWLDRKQQPPGRHAKKRPHGHRSGNDSGGPSSSSSYGGGLV